MARGTLAPSHHAKRALVVALIFASALGGASSGCQGPDDVVATITVDSPAVGGSANLGGGPPDSAWGGSGSGDEPRLLSLTGDLEAHDPSLIEAGATYYLFHTGPGIPLKTSTDLLSWKAAGSAFEELPAWIGELLPDVTNLWAPDVVRFGGLYHLYYAASTFGTGESCIGHATASDLRVDTVWNDQGPLICSDVDEIVDWDAIDPNHFVDADGQRYMVFGSYSTGIKMIPLDGDGNRQGEAMFDLAQRPVEVAIQAPTALYRAPYYYLFSTFDRCCEGVNSTSNIRIGRAEQVEGPYVDRDGAELLEGGGSVFLEGNERFRGVGANSIFQIAGRTFHAYHAYDANAAGTAILRIGQLGWDEDDWPVAAGP